MNFTNLKSVQSFISYSDHRSLFMAVRSQRLDESLFCHALSSDDTILAASTNETITLYERNPSNDWQKNDVFSGHEQTVSGLDWAPSEHGERLVSCSYDRNSYVWTKKNDPSNNNDIQTWQPELVITKLTRAGLCVKWSNNGLKFAIGSGEPSICVCYHDKKRDLWAPKLIKKGHSSSITSLAWHPSDALLLTTSTDGTCRIFCASLPAMDTSESLPPLVSGGGGKKFGDCLLELPTKCGWGLAVAWSPSGTSFAVACQEGLFIITGFDTSVTDADVLKAQLIRQDVKLPGLPLKCIRFFSENVIVGGGFDYKPLVVRKDGQGNWSVDGYVEPADDGTGRLKNCIMSGCLTKGDGGRRFLSASLDGQIAEWNIPS